MRERQPPHPRMDIPISRDVYDQLLTASLRGNCIKEDWEIATEAIDEWLRRHQPDSIPMPAIKGYQWKSLFLPDGTLLRTVFAGKNYHCLVENDVILYNGDLVSPSGFVNAVGGMRRNAWRSTWVLLPHTDQWQLADTLRPPSARIRRATRRGAQSGKLRQRRRAFHPTLRASRLKPRHAQRQTSPHQPSPTRPASSL